MRRRWFMSGPNAFSMRKAISGVSVALPWRRSESVARRTLRISAAFDTLSPRASMISVLISSPGWGGFFIGITGLLMVVDQVDVAGRIRLFVVAENQTPVSGYSQAPASLHVALERVQLPSRKPVELFEILGGLQGERKFPQLVGHHGRNSLGAVDFMEPPQPFMAKANQLHLIPSQFQHVRLYRTSQEQSPL